MFVDDFCEDWDSTKTQDDFIEKYFGKRKVNSRKTSNALELEEKSRDIDISKTSVSKSVNKDPINYEEECIRKIRKQKQTLHDSSLESYSEISQNINGSTTLNCETNNLKNRKRKKKKKKNISSNLSEHVGNDFSNEAKVIHCLSEDSLKNVHKESIESNSNSQKKKKRKRVNSFLEDESIVSNELLVEGDTINKAAFRDSSIIDNNVSESDANSVCLSKKKKKKKLKNLEKHSKPSEFSSGEIADSKNSYDLSSKQNNISETSSNNTLFNDSNSLKKKKNKLQNVTKSPQLDDLPTEEDPVNSETVYDSSMRKSNLLQNKAYQKLQAAKFRYLNEMLYTNSGKDSLTYFQQNTDEFKDYHAGYQSQVSKWPINPVNIIIQEISKMNKQAVIADLGCGEAKIAEVFPKRTVHSFDLIALKDCVTACDMANVPLPSNSVDVVIFCLSLMGTNWKDYLREGQRILKLGGMMKIAEIESRIENVQYFIKEIKNFGFSLINQNLSHKMFVFLNFKRISRSKKSSKVPEVTLKPCLYKKR